MLLLLTRAVEALEQIAVALDKLVTMKLRDAADEARQLRADREALKRR